MNPDARVDPALALLQALARAVAQHRAREPALANALVAFELLEAGSAARAFALVCDRADVRVHAGELALPGMPRAGLRLTTADFLALARAEVGADTLLREGRLTLRGDAALLRALGAALRPGERWWQLRAPRREPPEG